MLQTFNPKNKNLLVYINGELLPRGKAKVSVFDSVVQGGDAVWEGLRVYNGKIFALEEHLNRLLESANTLAFEAVPDLQEIKAAIFQTLLANQMRDETHIRLTLTRGEKITSGMNPKLNQSGPTLIVLAEWKPPIYQQMRLKLITSHIRRNSPQSLDSKIHHNNLINNILAKIEANLTGADDAVMLDINGFVSETNATNIFIIKNCKIYTPHADSCLPGITRQMVLSLASEKGLSMAEKNISIAECYNADEVFTTGTMGELAPVDSIDGRIIKNRNSRALLPVLQAYYQELIDRTGVPIPE